MSVFIEQEAREGNGDLSEDMFSEEYSYPIIERQLEKESNKKRNKRGKKQPIISSSSSDSESEKEESIKKTQPPNPKRSRTDKSEGPSVAVLAEIQKTNQILSSLVQRVKKTEKRVKQIETQISSGSGTSGGVASDVVSTPSRSRKKFVPDEVRVRFT